MKTLILTLALLATQTLLAASFDVVRVHEDVNYFNTEILKVDADLYKPTGTPILGTVVLFPSNKGVSIADTNTARFFARSGFGVIVLLPFEGDTEIYKPSVAAMRLVEVTEEKLAFKKTLPLFSMGANKSGIRALRLTAFHPRIKATWFAMQDEDFYVHTEVEGLVKFRAQHMKNLGITNEMDYDHYLRAHLLDNPLMTCTKIDGPVEKTCPTQKSYRIYAGHITGSATLFYMRNKIKSFFLSRLID